MHREHIILKNVRIFSHPADWTGMNNELTEWQRVHKRTHAKANEKRITSTLVNGICSEVEKMTTKMPTNYEYFHAMLDLDWKCDNDSDGKGNDDNDDDGNDDNTGFRHVKQDVGIHVVQ